MNTKIPPFLVYVVVLFLCTHSDVLAQQAGQSRPDDIQQGITTNFPVEQFFDNVQIHAITTDRRGLVYFAFSNGIAEFDGVEWREISVPASPGMFALASDGDGRIYGAGENELGYLLVDRFGNTKYQSLLDSLNFTVSDTFFDVRPLGNTIYFIGLNSILSYKDSRLNKVAEGSFISSGILQNVLIVNDQSRGLLYFDGTELQRIQSGELIRSTAMASLDANTLLLSTRSAGLLALTSDSGLINISPWINDVSDFINTSSISSLDVFAENLIAVGSYSEGVVIANRDGSVRTLINTSQGLLNDNAYDVFFTPKSTLWIGLNEGVSFLNLPALYEDIEVASAGTDTLSPEELAALADTTAEKWQLSVWFSRNVQKMKSWFSSSSDTLGTTLDPEEPARQFVSIVRKVEYIPSDSLIFGGAFSQTVNGVQGLQQSDTLIYEFPFDFNAFRFSYATNKYEDIGNIAYQVKLEGLDRGWSTWSENTYREYTNLDWGDYTFLVRAKNAGNEVSREAEFSFSIIPPWYESTWFYLIQFGTLFLALCISGILNKTGKAISLSEALIAVVVIVIFQYVDFYIDPFLDDYSNDIAIFKIGISIVFGFSLEFIEETFHKIIAKITGLAEKKHEDEGAFPTEEFSEQTEITHN